MFLRTQQVVDLIGINRGLYELEVHAAQDTPMAENVNGVFLLFCTTSSPPTPARGRGFDSGLRLEWPWRIERAAGQVLGATPCSIFFISGLSEIEGHLLLWVAFQFGKESLQLNLLLNCLKIFEAASG